MMALRSLPIHNIVPNPDQPRKRFDTAAMTELSDSIRSVGVLEPIVVRPRPGDWNSRHWRTAAYAIVAGERRWRAAKLAGLTDIPAIVRDDLDDRSAFELSMIENVIRADMNPIEEASGYQQLLDQGLTAETISERLGKSAASIKSRLRLLALDPTICDLVAANQLDAWTAGHIAKLSRESQFKVVKAMSEGLLAKGDVNAVERLCSALAERDARVDMFEDDFMQPAQPTVMVEMPTIDPSRAATRQLGTDIVRAIEALEVIAAAVESGVTPPSDALLVAERLTKLSGRVSKAIHRADAVRLAAEL